MSGAHRGVTLAYLVLPSRDEGAKGLNRSFPKRRWFKRTKPVEIISWGLEPQSPLLGKPFRPSRKKPLVNYFLQSKAVKAVPPTRRKHDAVPKSSSKTI